LIQEPLPVLVVVVLLLLLLVVVVAVVVLLLVLVAVIVVVVELVMVPVVVALALLVVVVVAVVVVVVVVVVDEVMVVVVVVVVVVVDVVVVVMGLNVVVVVVVAIEPLVGDCEGFGVGVELEGALVLIQESVLVVLLDGNDLNNPGGQASHCGCTVAEPAVFVYLPAGHFVWAPHHSKGQPFSVGVYTQLPTLDLPIVPAVQT